MPSMSYDNHSDYSNTSSSASRTPPNCARCKNHGIKIPLNGHKRYCLYWNCNCEKCMLTTKRQKTMAKETARRRAERQHEKKIEERKTAIEIARKKGERLPDKPIEFLNPILSPKSRMSEHTVDRILSSPKSDRSYDSGSYAPLNADSSPCSSSVNAESLSKDEPSSSYKVDTLSALRELQELLLSNENFSLMTTTLLYSILKENPNPKDAYHRIMDAQNELSRSYTREDGSLLGISANFTREDSSLPASAGIDSLLPCLPSQYSPRSSLIPQSAFLFSHPLAFSASQYYSQYAPHASAFSASAYRYHPYLRSAAALRSAPDFINSQPLALHDDSRTRLSFNPLQLKEEDRLNPGPSNLCIREISSAYRPLDLKFSISETK